MTLSVSNPVSETWIVALALTAAPLLSIRKVNHTEILPLQLTTELKGLAILFIIFSHIGYQLVSDHRFLFPLSALAGVGVNMFFFLSGYGLTMSSLNNRQGILTFYKKRLLKLLIPLWLTLTLFFLVDNYILGRSYAPMYILQSFLAYFPRADISLDVDSPLWYLTPLLFYYLLFPLIFYRKYPWLSAIALYTLSTLIIPYSGGTVDLVHLYKLHTLAFPLGMILAWSFNRSGVFKSAKEKLVKRTWIRLPLLLALCVWISRLAVNSGVDSTVTKEQLLSILTMLLIVALFIVKKIEFRLLTWFGLYSYEIYLLHWPILSRYSNLYKVLPAGIATIAYLAIFLGLGWLVNKALSRRAII